VAEQWMRGGELGESEVVGVSSGMEEVNGTEEMEAEKAVVKGIIKVVGQEQEGMRGRSIDIEELERGWAEEQVERQVFEEIERGVEEEVAYRGKQRWVGRYEKVRRAEAREEEEEGAGTLKAGGVYVITGGRGWIGTALSRYIGKDARGKVAVIGRGGLGAGTEEDVRRRREMEDMREAGVEIEEVVADVREEEEMKRAVEWIEERLGPINGVIHLAGGSRATATCAIRDTGRSHCDEHFQPKAAGIRVIQKIFENRKLDFCISFSSLATILGGLGYAAYSGANMYLDVFARSQNRKGPTWWASINWDAWRFGRMRESRGPARNSLTEFGLTPDQGIEVFRRILSFDPLPQIIVSTDELQQRINQWVKLEFLQELKKQARDHTHLHPRPALDTVYVAPGNQIEDRIAQVWQRLLGIDRVGIIDNFFSLGGDSLLAIQVMSRFREEFGVNLPLRAIFDSPTVAELATWLVRQETAAADGEMVSHLLAELELLSEDEVDAALASEQHLVNNVEIYGRSR
jgi:acyl carrier protein/NADP-dependent 3-hydroxy acid dehydrogenase YdfG